MKLELVVTGSELVRGRIADTNTAWLLSRVEVLGADCQRVTVVGDDAGNIENALKEAASRAEVVLVSGGLGPTSDDLTAACAARIAGTTLAIDPGTLTRLRARYAARGRTPTPMQERQALVPAAAVVLDNDEGTAPGFRLQIGGATCFFFAGVPREFKHLAERHFLPWLGSQGALPGAAKGLRFVLTPESDVDALLLPVAQRHGVELELRASFPETIAVFALPAGKGADTRERVEAACSEAFSIVGDKASPVDRPLAEIVVRAATSRGFTIATAESCTGGLLGGAITAVPGSSRAYVGGVVTYANELKIQLLGVAPELIAAHGAVSEPVARAMSEGARARLGATFGVGITGVAGPDGGTPEKPVGTVWVSIAGPGGTSAQLVTSFRKDRDSIRAAAVAFALDGLRRLVEAP